jgi:hypothetical protein
MTAFTDEMLSAYLDGEAGAELAARIEQAAGEDEALAMRLQRMSAGDGALRHAADALLGPTPPRLLAALEAAPSAEVLPFTPRARRPAPSFNWAQLAAAGVSALVIGGIAGSMLTPRHQPLVGGSGPDLAVGGQLAQALSTARSGEAAEVDGGTVRVALSFRAGDGRLCRQFDVAGKGDAASAIACKGAEDWRIEGWAKRPPSATGYQMAAGPEDNPINAIADRLGVAETLDAAGETQAMKDGWTSAKPR